MTRERGNGQYLSRQFKNTANYLRLLFDPDLYSLCKSYPVREILLPKGYSVRTKQRIRS